ESRLWFHGVLRARSGGERSEPERSGLNTLPDMSCREHRRCLVAQRRVRPTVIVIVLPPGSVVLRIANAIELLCVEQLIAQPAVERLRVTVLPRRKTIAAMYTKLWMSRCINRHPSF